MVGGGVRARSPRWRGEGPVRRLCARRVLTEGTARAAAARAAAAGAAGSLLAPARPSGVECHAPACRL